MIDDAMDAIERNETLFIDARKLGTMIDWMHRELTDEDIQRQVTELSEHCAESSNLEEQIRKNLMGLVTGVEI